MPGMDESLEVLAAGAVVIHHKRVLLIHRRRYGDWTLPKGKLEPGEHPTVAAAREVWEETGVAIRLGRPLADQTYLVRKATKRVRYWLGHPVGDPDLSHFEPNREVDVVAWVPLAEALKKLSYPRDQEHLGVVMQDPTPSQTLIILRHASARPRSKWHGGDESRPLTKQGFAEARRILTLLSAYHASHLLASTALRCVATLAPYSASSGWPIRQTVALGEGQLGENATQQLQNALGYREPVVLCSHRPVIPSLCRAAGIEPIDLAPAEALVVHHRLGEVVAEPEVWRA
jgi:8-oxo-(d)GTP phosphatase